MRVLIVGCGSIGTRHLRNLWDLGIRDIVVTDVRLDRLTELQRLFGVKTVGDFDEALAMEPDVVFVTVPTHLHIPLALKAAQFGCHLFIEKPLSHTMVGVDELINLVQQKKLVTLVGCNMRFHYGPSTIERLLRRNAIGKVVSAHLEAGQYLPDWHPWEDYRQGYSAHQEMGGGVILDCIHEIDYARWLFGEVREVFCFGGKLSSLEIDTEDCVNIVMKFNVGFSATVHLDYVQRTYARSCKVIGEEGTILWDIADGTVRYYSADRKNWTLFKPLGSYDLNQMYIEELRHFLRCLEGKERSAQDIREAKRVLEIALAIRESMHRGQKVIVRS